MSIILPSAIPNPFFWKINTLFSFPYTTPLLPSPGKHLLLTLYPDGSLLQAELIEIFPQNS